MIIEGKNKSIEKIYIQKLSTFITDASEYMVKEMKETIKNDLELQKQIKKQLKKLDVFKINKTVSAVDIQNICLLAGFLFFLKITVYLSLRKEVKLLKLKTLILPDNKNNITNSIRDKFDDVLKFGYDYIFEPSVFDKFKFIQDYVPVLKKNIKEIEQINLSNINADIFGSIYNTLFNNPEQTEKGQYFTNTDEVNIVNAFCINKNTKDIIDTACGAGAFLVRAYAFLKYHHPKLSHKELLEKIWGIDIASFPAFLAKINLSILDLKLNTQKPKIVNKNFSDLTKSSKLKLTEFDACIGNPPYIRQELIKDKKKWTELVRHEFGIKNLNKQSDLYVYYLMHTATFLKEGGRLGYVIASSWLDVSYGKDLQKFLLDNFKIIAIIDQQDTRSFETASVNTVILIIEKCSNKKKRERNQVKFVRINNSYSKFIGQINDKNRFNNLSKFVNSIEASKSNISAKDFSISCINQKELEEQSTKEGRYQNGHWGTKYLRSPEIYNNIVSSAKNSLVPLRELCEIKYGIKTGANNFFYLTDETDKIIESKKKDKEYWSKYGWYYSKLDNKHYIIDKKHIKPLLKSQREVQNLTIKTKELKYSVLDIKSNKSKLKESNSELYNYINIGESSKHKINKRATCAGRISKNGESDWFNLAKEIIIGDFIIPSKIGEKFRLMDNRKAKVYCDKVSYNICIKPEYQTYSDILFAILNSTIFRYFIDLFSRQLTGSQTLSDVDVNVVQDTLIPHPKYLIEKAKELKDIMKSMNSREQKSIFREMDFEDRKQLDSLIMTSLGFGKKESELIRKKAVEFVQTRKIKSESVKTIKKSGVKK